MPQVVYLLLKSVLLLGFSLGTGLEGSEVRLHHLKLVLVYFLCVEHFLALDDNFKEELLKFGVVKAALFLIFDHAAEKNALDIFANNKGHHSTPESEELKSVEPYLALPSG